MVSDGKGRALERIFLFFRLCFRTWLCRQVPELPCLVLMTEGDGVPIIVVNYCVQRRWEGQQRVKRWGNYLSAPGICYLLEPAGWPFNIKDTASYFHLLLCCHSFSHLLLSLPSFTSSCVVFWDSHLNHSYNWRGKGCFFHSGRWYTECI